MSESNDIYVASARSCGLLGLCLTHWHNQVFRIKFRLKATKFVLIFEFLELHMW